MSEMKDIRKHINQAANQHTEIVDNDAIWAGIQEKMDKPKKRRPIIPLFIWGISFLTITLVGIGLLSEKTITNTTDSNQEFFTNTNEKKATKVYPTLESKTPINEQIKLENRIDSDESKIVKNQKKSVVGNSINSVTSNYSITSIIKSQNSDNSSDYSFINEEDFKKKTSIITPDKTPNKYSKVRGPIKLPRIGTSFNRLLFEREKIYIALENENPKPQHSYKSERFSFFNSLTIYSQYGGGSKSIQPINTFADLRNQSEELMEQIRFGIESDLVNLLDFTIYGGVSYVSINNKVIRNETYYEDKEITYLKSISISTSGSEIETYVTEDLPHLVKKNPYDTIAIN